MGEGVRGRGGWGGWVIGGVDDAAKPHLSSPAQRCRPNPGLVTRYSIIRTRPSKSRCMVGALCLVCAPLDALSPKYPGGHFDWQEGNPKWSEGLSTKRKRIRNRLFFV